VDAFISALEGEDLMATQLTSHPGQTLLWLGAAAKTLLGLTEQHFPYTPESFPAVHRAQVFPIALVTSLAVAFVYLLLLKLTKPTTALLGGLLLALDPFFIANSRVFQLDALLASFMMLSALPLLVYFKDRRWGFLALSAICGALAILTKLTAVFLVPYLFLTLFVDWVITRNKLRHYFLAVGIWLLTFALIFTTVYPAMWASPVLALKNIKWLLGQQALLSPHPRTSFFLGRVVSEPGVLYYPVVLALRSTPITLILGILGVFLGIGRLLKKKLSLAPHLLLFVLFFLLAITIASKKGNRYALPAVLGLDVLAAYGLVWASAWFSGKFASKVSGFRVWIIPCVLFTIYFLLFLPLNSHYLSFYNPLFGGARVARKTIVLGWGEGFYEVAEYLNQKPNAEKLKVLSFFEGSLAPLFKGRVFKFGQVGDSGVDYLVFYVSQVQRGIDAEIVGKYFSSEEPEYVVELNGVDYAWIFRAKKDV